MTQVLHSGADAAYPGTPLPEGTEILAAYVGGGGTNATNVWTAANWNSYVAEFPKLRLLPIWAHSYGDATPEADALGAVAAVKALGWGVNMPGPDRRIIVVDCEILVDPAYFTAVCNTINANGFRPVLYGSQDYVMQNPNPSFGYWVANWNYTAAPTALPSGVLGIQWQSGNPWDLDTFSDELFLACGVGPRVE